MTTGDRFLAILVLVTAATGVVPLWLLRGFWARRGGSPDQLLDDLEQRTLVRRRVGLARAGVATFVVGAVSGVLALVVLQRGLTFAEYSHDLWLAVCTVVVAVVVGGIAFWLSDRRCVAVLEEVRQARALLSSAEGEKS